MKATENIVQDNQIGSIKYVKSRRARRLIITIKSDHEIRVAIPFGVSQRAAERFVASHYDWIREHQLRLKSKAHRQDRTVVPLPENELAARNLLNTRLAELAKRNHFKYNCVSFRKQRTRWGSCSYQNNISLNLKIASLPGELQDYILLHELVHTRVKNHGPKFWSELDIVTQNQARELAKALRQYRLV